MSAVVRARQEVHPRDGQPNVIDSANLGEKKTDRWSFTPEQLAPLQKAKDKAKEVGLSNLFLPDNETGQGLNNRLRLHRGRAGKKSDGLGNHQRSAPDTGNMEVLERVGAKQEGQVAEAAARREIRSAYAITKPNVASSDAKNISTAESWSATSGSSTARNITSPAPAIRAARS